MLNDSGAVTSAWSTCGRCASRWTGGRRGWTTIHRRSCADSSASYRSGSGPSTITPGSLQPRSTFLLTCRGTSSGPSGTSQEVSASGCSSHLHLDSNNVSSYVGVPISALIFWLACLKALTVLAFFTVLGVRFHASTTLLEKKCRLTSSLASFCLGYPERRHDRI
jgi:hypothetical protein